MNPTPLHVQTTSKGTLSPVLLPLHNFFWMCLAGSYNFPIRQHSWLVGLHPSLAFNHVLHILCIPLHHLILHSNWRLPLLPLIIIVLSFLFIVAPLIRHHSGHDVLPHDSQYQEQPEEIHGLQAGQQTKCDALREEALELTGLPVELKGADGAEFRESCVEDGQIDIMAEVDPDEDEEAEIGADDGGIKVVESF